VNSGVLQNFNKSLSIEEAAMGQLALETISINEAGLEMYGYSIEATDIIQRVQ
jgi:hypothetical protein